MNGYLNPNGAPVVEASAITGTGVTATLRAAVARILDNLKNNVDTTLHEEPELEAPDMSAKSGVTQMSAGTPKLSMKSTPTFDAEETMTVSPFEVDPLDVSVEEEDPFGVMVADEPSRPSVHANARRIARIRRRKSSARSKPRSNAPARTRRRCARRCRCGTRHSLRLCL